MGVLRWLFPRPRRPDMPAGSMTDALPTISSEEFFRSLSTCEREAAVPEAVSASAASGVVPAAPAASAPHMTAAETPMMPPVTLPPEVLAVAPDLPDGIGTVVEPTATPETSTQMHGPFETAPEVAESVGSEMGDVANVTASVARDSDLYETASHVAPLKDAHAGGPGPVEAPAIAPVATARGPIVDGVALDDALALYAVQTCYRTHLGVTRDTRLVVHSMDFVGAGLAPLLAVVPKANGGVCFLLAVDDEIASFGIVGDPMHGPVVSLRIAAAGADNLVMLRRPLATDYLSAEAQDGRRDSVCLVDRELSQSERFHLQPVSHASLSPRTAGYLASLRALCIEPLTGERVMTFLRSDPNAPAMAEGVGRVLPEGEIAWLGQHLDSLRRVGPPPDGGG